MQIKFGFDCQATVLPDIEKRREADLANVSAMFYVGYVVSVSSKLATQVLKSQDIFNCLTIDLNLRHLGSLLLELGSFDGFIGQRALS